MFLTRALLHGKVKFDDRTPLPYTVFQQPNSRFVGMRGNQSLGKTSLGRTVQRPRPLSRPSPSA